MSFDASKHTLSSIVARTIVFSAAGEGDPSEITHRTATLDDLPVEILVHIYQHLNVSAVFGFARASKFFRHVFLLNKSTILFPVLRREFSPFGELLQAYSAKEEDLHTSAPAILPKRIIYRRAPLDAGLVLAEGARRTLASVREEYAQLQKTKGVPGSAPATSVADRRLAVLTDADLNPILEWCMVVRKWEEQFPRLRWIEEPCNCRFLRPHEKERLRRALYRWWRYAILFNGEFPRPRPGLPETYDFDVRIGTLRLYSTSEIHELEDLAFTVDDLIKQYIFPILIKDYAMSENKLFDSPSHLDMSFALVKKNVRTRVLDTYAKLGPADLLRYFETIYSFTKKTLVADINVHHSGFARDTSSFKKAIYCALFERARKPFGVDDLKSTHNEGGIVDGSRWVEDARVEFGHDASADGAVDHSLGHMWGVNALDTPTRGDDGMTMEEESMMPLEWVKNEDVASRRPESDIR